MEKNVYVVFFLLTCGAEEVFVLQQIVDTEKSNIPIREPSRQHGRHSCCQNKNDNRMNM